MFRSIFGFLFVLSVLTGKGLSQPRVEEFQKIMKDDKKLNFMICTSAISFFTSEKQEMLKIQNLVKESTIDDIRKEPSKAFEKMIMKASVECIDEIKHLSREERVKLVGKIMEKDKEEIQKLINVDEGIFRFGGDLELSPREEEVKDEMMKIKDQFEKQSGGGGKYDKYDKHDLHDLKRKREEMAKDLERRMKELKQGRNKNLFFFGIMLLIVVIVLVWQCYFKGGNGGGKFDMNEDVLKANEIIEQREIQLRKEVKKLKRMRKAMKKKMLELGIEKKEIKRLEKTDSEEEEELVRDRGKQGEGEESD